MSELKFVELACQRCGGNLKELSDGKYVCNHCGREWKEVALQDFKNIIDGCQEALRRQRVEDIAHLRQLLWKAVNEEFGSNKEVESLCNDILKFSPGDFYASFYLAACSKSKATLGLFLKGVDIDEHYDDIPEMLNYILKSLKPEWSMSTGDFIERAYKSNDLKLYNKYRTMFDDENAKNDECVYQTDFPRDVFIAYSSKDMPKVEELVSVLEDSELTCFVAARNLRHGSGAVENYEKAIHTAIENCSVLVFVSSDNSRSISCDAYKELNFIERDSKKMPRVEYLIKDYCGKPSERFFKKFFNGLEYCTSVEDVAARVCDILMAEPEPVHDDKTQVNTEMQQSLEQERKRREAEEAERKAKAEAEQRAREEQERKAEEERQRKLHEETERKHREQERFNAILNLGDYKDIGGGYVTFGTYPQSKKAKNVSIGEIFDKDRGYYLGSDKCLYAQLKGEYYKVEPIKWKVLQSGNEKFIVADDILDAHRFDKSSNNYEKSEIRKWLNSDFYNKAFNDSQKSKILTTTVDNGKSSTCKIFNRYVCGNTKDKIYLLSRKEAEELFSNKESRKRAPTGYASLRGAFGSAFGERRNGKTCGWWWLRSPYSYDSGGAQDVKSDGSFDYNGVNIDVHYSNSGVVPALKFKP